MVRKGVFPLRHFDFPDGLLLALLPVCDDCACEDFALDEPPPRFDIADLMSRYRLTKAFSAGAFAQIMPM